MTALSIFPYKNLGDESEYYRETQSAGTAFFTSTFPELSASNVHIHIEVHVNHTFLR